MSALDPMKSFSMEFKGVGADAVSKLTVTSVLGSIDFEVDDSSSGIILNPGEVRELIAFLQRKLEEEL